MHKMNKSKTFLVNLMRLQVGQEKPLVKEISNTNSQALFFKVLGKYDILEFKQLSLIEDSNQLNTDPRIVELTTFPCFYWGNDYKTFWAALSNSPAPSLVSLKINEAILKRHGLLGLQKVLTFLASFKSIRNYPLFPLSGLGYYEILLFFPSDNFEDIFELLRSILDLSMGEVFQRSISQEKELGLFTDTITLPLISYQQVIFPSKWNLLKGKISPITRINCLPNYEIEFGDNFWSEGRHVLGEYDLIFTWKNPIRLSQFIKHLFEFRASFLNNFAVIDTSSSLISKELLSWRKRKKRSIPYIRSQPYLVETLHELAQKPGIDRYLINELIAIISLINSCVARFSMSLDFMRVFSSISTTLQEKLTQYVTYIDRGLTQDRTLIEGDILLYGDIFQKAVSQRFPSIEISDYQNATHQASMPSTARILTAASSIVDKLIHDTSKSAVPSKIKSQIKNMKREKQILREMRKRWAGFIYFDPEGRLSIV